MKELEGGGFRAEIVRGETLPKQYLVRGSLAKAPRLRLRLKARVLCAARLPVVVPAVPVDEAHVAQIDVIEAIEIDGDEVAAQHVEVPAAEAVDAALFAEVAGGDACRPIRRCRACFHR